MEHSPLSIAETYHPVQRVREIQRDIAAGTCPIPPRELLTQPAWQDTAQFLTRFYFYQWVRKDLDAVEVVEQIYRHALYWYPVIQQRLPGAYGPQWNRGAVLYWLRQGTGPATGNWWLATVEIPDRGAGGVVQAVENAVSIAGVADGPAWVNESLELLFRSSQAGDLKARLAVLVYAPLAYADIDRAWDEEFWYSKHARQRRAAARDGSGDYLRLGRRALIIGDSYARQRRPDLDWTDLREAFAEVLDYRIRYAQAGRPALEITLKPDVVEAAKAQLNQIAERAGSAAHKLRVINDMLRAFESRHGWDPGVQWQFGVLERVAQSLIRQHCLAERPQARGELYRLRADNPSDAPELDVLLDPEAPEEAWVRLFSPYR